MKKYISLAIAALCVLGLASCSKLLDYGREGVPSQDNYPLTDQQANDAIENCYYGLFERDGMFSREIYWEQGCANDMVWGKSRGFNTLATLSYTGNEGPLIDSYNRIYNRYGISKTNWVVQTMLDKQERAGKLSAVESRVLGEAYFLRGQYHFLAAYRYGTKELGVPFVAYETVEGGYHYEIPEQQESVMKNYELIVSDLQKAEELLPRFEEYGAADRGRAHKASAAALMAKVYTYWAMWDNSQWKNVIDCVNRLEQQYGRDLVENYKDVFSPEFEIGFWNKEYCWGIPGTGGADGSGNGGVELPGVMLEDKGWGVFNGWGQIKPSYDLYEEMAKDNEDTNGDGVSDYRDQKNIRLATTILEYNDEFPYNGGTMRFYSPVNIEAGFQCNKYMQPFAYELKRDDDKQPEAFAKRYVLDNGNWPVVRVMWPIVRFADCLLLRAEAYLATGNAAAAAQDINRVRRRSHLKEIGGSATWTDLYHERRCELAFEFANDHAFDCKRWAVAGAPEIKALALNELNSHPRVRIYENRMDPESPYVVGPYADYQTPVKVWDDKYLTFPYPTDELTKANGKLQNPPSWR